jgi:hypothetical protein
MSENILFFHNTGLFPIWTVIPTASIITSGKKNHFIFIAYHKNNFWKTFLFLFFADPYRELPTLDLKQYYDAFQKFRGLC